MTTSNKVVYTGVSGRPEIFNTANVAADIRGGEFDDYIFANGQNDFIEGGIDEDYINALSGDDIIFGDNQADGVQGSSVGSLTSEADVIRGGAGNDIIFSQSGFDYVNGESGNDYIHGGLGADFLQGGADFDTVIGGAGDDQIWAGGTTNVPAGYAKTVNYTHDGITDAASAGTVNSDFGTISSNDGGNDYLDGGAGNDFIFGQGGEDVILGGDGLDYIEGNDGNDVISGGKDNDFAYGGLGNDWVQGDAGNDVLLGNAGADRIEGGEGNDYIVGGPGYDLLIGGSGFDTFEFHRSDLQVGIWSTVADLGSVAGNYDVLLVEGFGANLAFYQDGANTLIYDAAVGLAGGIIVQNTAVADLQAHLVLV